MEAEKTAMKLVLADSNTPGMNGLDLRKQLRRNPDLPSLMVAMVTAEAERDHMSPALEAGDNAYVMKPFPRDVEKLHLMGVQPERV